MGKSRPANCAGQAVHAALGFVRFVVEVHGGAAAGMLQRACGTFPRTAREPLGSSL
jgi:hypothetical protein